MEVNPISELPPPQRLALAYAPARSRAQTLALLAYDAQLGLIVRRTSEPILGQMRLAWWRDQLALPAGGRPKGNRVLAMLAALEGEEHALREMASGWEVLLGEHLGADAIREHSRSRAAGWLAMARLQDADEESVERAAQCWALGDLAANLGGSEQQRVVEIGEPVRSSQPRLPRTFRSLAVLAGLGRRSLARGGAPLLAGPGSVLAAIRLGISGR